jgi:cytochrome c oxidase cbb3-type subunit 3
MSDEKKNLDENQYLTDHDYDGIREFDYQLPRWWLNMFYLTILFAVGYFAYFQMLAGTSIQQEYQAEQDKLEYMMATAAAKGATISEADLVAMVKDPAKVKAGKDLFQVRCVACHGNAGQGLIGPNLTDDYWIHGGKLTEISNTITNGVPDKGMPPWGTVMSAEQIHFVVAYIRSIRGSSPAGAKAPQGEPFKE